MVSTLFDQLVREGEPALHALVQDRQQEHVQLDFKRKSDGSHGSPNDDDKRTLGEALSGFSNSAGGLLVWGVDARKGADGIDCAQSLEPISDIQRFNASVTNLIGQLLMPRHEGVRTAVIRSNPTSGYLLLDVDRSERRPHRSEAKGRKGYYKRIGDSFFEMEHYDIEDAFNRVHVPSLSFAWRIDRSITYGGSGEGGFDADITLQLRNNSARTARFPYLYIRRPKGANLESSGGYISPLQFRVRTEGEWTYFIGGADHVINPETHSR
jgi:hypothetical protein